MQNQMTKDKLTCLGILTFISLIYGAFSFSNALPNPIQPDPTYQTGIISILSSQLKSSLTYTVSYNWAMSTSSLNASLGVVGIDLQTQYPRHGFRMMIMSLNKSALIMYVAVKYDKSPLNILKISYLVSYNPYFDIGYWESVFSNEKSIQVALIS